MSELKCIECGADNNLILIKRKGYTNQLEDTYYCTNHFFRMIFGGGFRRCDVRDDPYGSPLKQIHILD